MEEKLQYYAKLAEVSIEDLKGKSRKKQIVTVRHIIYFILKSEGHSHRAIAELFNKKSRGTIVAGVRVVQNLLSVRDKEILTLFSKMNLLQGN